MVLVGNRTGIVPVLYSVLRVGTSIVAAGQEKKVAEEDEIEKEKECELSRT